MSKKVFTILNLKLFNLFILNISKKEETYGSLNQDKAQIKVKVLELLKVLIKLEKY